MIAEELTWTEDLTKLNGRILPHTIATTPDTRTAIEITGTISDPRLICVVGEIPHADSARQLAQCMVLALRFALPSWDGVGAWLTKSLQSVKLGPRIMHVRGWKLRMEWLPENSTVTLKASRLWH